MKLILVKTENAKMVIDPDGSCDGSGNPAPVYCFQDLEVRNTSDVIYKMCGGRAVIKMMVHFYPVTSGFDFDLPNVHVSCAGFDLFGKFLEFKDKVRLSLKISTSLGPETRRSEYRHSLTFPEMTIEGKNPTICAGHSKFVGDFFRLNTFSKEVFAVKVVADIEDDLVLIPKPNPSPSPVVDMCKKALEGGVASDVVIKTANGEEIPANKCFLIESSPVLGRLLGSGSEGQIDCTNISSEGVRAFLCYIYLHEVLGPEASLDVAYEVLYLAHQYEVTALEQAMVTYLTERRNEEFSTNLALKIWPLVREIKTETGSELKEKLVRVMGFDDQTKTLDRFREIQKDFYIRMIMMSAEDAVDILRTANCLEDQLKAKGVNQGIPK